MARKRQSGATGMLNDAQIEAILSAGKELLEEHRDEVNGMIDDSDSKSGTVTLGIELDASDSVATIAVRIRFSNTVTDSRTLRCDNTDPNQQVWETLTPDALKAQRDAAKLAAKEEEGEDKSKRRASFKEDAAE